jgi:phage terminase large subunit GpA-like protein
MSGLTKGALDGSDAGGFSDEFFAQMEAEKREPIVERGLRHFRWVQVRERNEALDNLVMCLVALDSLKLNLVEEMNPIVVTGIGNEPKERQRPRESVTSAEGYWRKRHAAMQQLRALGATI